MVAMNQDQIIIALKINIINVDNKNLKILCHVFLLKSSKCKY